MFFKFVFLILLLGIAWNAVRLNALATDEFDGLWPGERFQSHHQTTAPPVLFKSRPMVERLDAYKVLGLPDLASDDEIKQAYRQQLKVYQLNMMRPLYRGAREEANAMLAEVKEAYEILTTKKRCLYDLGFHMDKKRYEECANAWIIKNHQEALKRMKKNEGKRGGKRH